MIQLTNAQIQAGLAQRLALGDAARQIARPFEYDLPDKHEGNDFGDAEWVEGRRDEHL